MDTLDGSEYDVLIAGTGIQQSLLALSLSRSDKKVLHVDKNDYYGGTEAAFSLQEAESWAEKPQDRDSPFINLSITKYAASNDDAPKLSYSRSYSLALAPELIYTDSKLLPSLVASQTYRQLEFVAMGSWFVYDNGQVKDGDSGAKALLQKIPTTREDLVFSDKSIDIRSKRAVMKVLRFLTDFESQEEIWQPFANTSFAEFLSNHFKLPPRLHGLFYALTLSLDSPAETTTAIALPQIARHLRAIGLFGPGFNSVIPKWGGMSEIAQVGCRACAVGGATYVLNKGVKHIDRTGQIRLSEDETVKAQWIIGTTEGLPSSSESQALSERSDETTAKKSITIVSSNLSSLFPPLAEGAPPPAGAVVVFPAATLGEDSLPVYLIVHSSDTGECPQGQSVIYAWTRGSQEFLTQAINRLMELVDESPTPLPLWCLRYEQRDRIPQPTTTESSRIIIFPSPSNDLTFDENILLSVKDAWQKIMGPDVQSEDFMVFEDRNQEAEEDNDQ